MGLEALVKGLPTVAATPELFPVDITDLFGQVDGEDCIFYFRKPSTGDMFALTDLIKKIQFQFEDFPNDLAENIALMARCFSEEGLDINKKWLLLATLVKRTEDEPQKFLTFKARFMVLFPAAFNLAEAEAEQKKMSAAEKRLMHLCVTYLHRLPEELSDQTLESVARLGAYDQMINKSR